VSEQVDIRASPINVFAVAGVGRCVPLSLELKRIERGKDTGLSELRTGNSTAISTENRLPSRKTVFRVT
jgi:hypothetical protein